MTPFTLIYDPVGPKVINLSTNYGYGNACVSGTCYINGKVINLNFDVRSVTDVKISQYLVNITGDNYSDSKLLFSKPTSISVLSSKNASQIRMLSLKIRNEYNVSSPSSQISLRQDLSEPQLSYDGVSESISCSDADSACSKIMYGFGVSAITCTASKVYLGSENISIPNSAGWICLVGYDLVGNKGFGGQSVSPLSMLTETPDVIISDYGSNQSISETDSESSDSNQDQYDEEETLEDPYNPDLDNSGSSPSTIYLVAALALVLVTISGSGYYAYSKGYLNKQLARFGIKGKNTVSNNNSFTPSFSSAQTSSSRLSGQDLSHTTQKGKFEDHISKVQNFLDNRVSKDNSLFDKFGSKTTKLSPSLRGKQSKDLHSIEERLAQSHQELVQRQEQLAKNSSVKKSTDSVKDEAIDFDEYLKRKNKK
jgi:hypothetical protein